MKITITKYNVEITEPKKHSIVFTNMSGLLIYRERFEWSDIELFGTIEIEKNNYKFS